MFWKKLKKNVHDTLAFLNFVAAFLKVKKNKEKKWETPRYNDFHFSIISQFFFELFLSFFITIHMNETWTEKQLENNIIVPSRFLVRFFAVKKLKNNWKMKIIIPLCFSISLFFTHKKTLTKLRNARVSWSFFSIFVQNIN